MQKHSIFMVSNRGTQFLLNLKRIVFYFIHCNNKKCFKVSIWKIEKKTAYDIGIYRVLLHALLIFSFSNINIKIYNIPKIEMTILVIQLWYTVFFLLHLQNIIYKRFQKKVKNFTIYKIYQFKYHFA